MSTRILHENRHTRFQIRNSTMPVGRCRTSIAWAYPIVPCQCGGGEIRTLEGSYPLHAFHACALCCCSQKPGFILILSKPEARGFEPLLPVKAYVLSPAHDGTLGLSTRTIEAV